MTKRKDVIPFIKRHNTNFHDPVYYLGKKDGKIYIRIDHHRFAKSVWGIELLWKTNSELIKRNNKPR